MPVASPFKPEPIIDRPFGVPIECVMDLPFPPSTNSIWSIRGGLKHNAVSLSPAYKKWKKEADMAVIANGTWRHRQRMPGAFAATLLLDRAQRAGDVDNRIKAVLDWAQRVEIVTNDKLCEEVTARWVATVDAPRGCRLILRSVTP